MYTCISKRMYSLSMPLTLLEVFVIHRHDGISMYCTLLVLLTLFIVRLLWHGMRAISSLTQRRMLKFAIA